MANILNIDSSGSVASICISQNDVILAYSKNEQRLDHAVWLHQAINDAFKDINLSIQELDAIAVSNGPGSYTGLRLGMATAKGLCYALKKPLICVPTLKVMALAAREDQLADYYHPMIDARRMEVFTAVYNNKLEELEKAKAIVLEDNCLKEWLEKGQTIVSGDGALKASSLHTHDNFILSKVETNASHMRTLSLQLLKDKNWADLAYCEPFYLKEFYSPKTL